MKYYKKINNQKEIIDLLENPIVENHKGLIKIKKDEFDRLLEFKNTLSEEEVLKNRILEKEKYLTDTDWITAKHNDEVVILENITKTDFIAKYQDVYNSRQKAREEINILEKLLKGL